MSKKVLSRVRRKRPRTKSMSDDEEPEASNSLRECGICNEDYNDRKNIPRILPCSHFLCSNCINKIISKGTQCPFCKQNFNANSAEDVMVNRPVLNYLGDSRGSKNTRITADKDLINLKNKIKKSIDAASRIPEKLQDETNIFLKSEEDMVSDIDSQGTMIKEMISSLTTLEKMNQIMKKDITEDKSEVTDYIKQLEDNKGKLESFKQKIDDAKNFMETGSLIDEVKNKQFSSENNIRLLQEKLTSNETKAREKDFQYTKENLRRLQDAQNTLKIISFEELERMSDRVKKLISEGNLYVVERRDLPKIKSAKLMIRENRLFVPYLHESIPPSSASIITHSDSGDRLFNRCVTEAAIYMDWKQNNEYYGTFFIRLIHGNRFTLAFLHHCHMFQPSYSSAQILTEVDDNGILLLILRLKGGRLSGEDVVIDSDDGSIISRKRINDSPEHYSEIGQVLEGRDVLKNVSICVSNGNPVSMMDVGIVWEVR